MMMNIMQTKTKEERQSIAAKGVATRRRNKEAREAIRSAEILEKDHLKREIHSLKKELNELQKHKIINAVSKKLTNKSLLSKQDIIDSSAPLSFSCGVYFLIKNKEVVYVGQSTNIFSRIATHSKDKKFDSTAYIACDKDMLDKLESLYIHVLQPELNGRNNGYILAPIMLDKLLAA